MRIEEDSRIGVSSKRVGTRGYAWADGGFVAGVFFVSLSQKCWLGLVGFCPLAGQFGCGAHGQCWLQGITFDVFRSLLTRYDKSSEHHGANGGMKFPRKKHATGIQRAKRGLRSKVEIKRRVRAS